MLAELQVPATTAGYEQLLGWARGQAAGAPLIWAIEGAGHYGLNLARHLAAAGQQVTEISHIVHAGKRRAGKTDAIDALRAARELLACEHPATPRADGDREALRLLRADRDHAVGACRSARALLAAVLVTMPGPLRTPLRALPSRARARACAALACPPERVRTYRRPRRRPPRHMNPSERRRFRAGRRPGRHWSQPERGLMIGFNSGHLRHQGHRLPLPLVPG